MGGYMLDTSHGRLSHLSSLISMSFVVNKKELLTIGVKVKILVVKRMPLRVKWTTTDGLDLKA